MTSFQNLPPPIKYHTRALITYTRLHNNTPKWRAIQRHKLQTKIVHHAARLDQHLAREEN